MAEPTAGHGNSRSPVSIKMTLGGYLVQYVLKHTATRKSEYHKLLSLFEKGKFEMDGGDTS